MVTRRYESHRKLDVVGSAVWTNHGRLLVLRQELSYPRSEFRRDGSRVIRVRKLQVSPTPAHPITIARKRTRLVIGFAHKITAQCRVTFAKLNPEANKTAK